MAEPDPPGLATEKLWDPMIERDHQWMEILRREIWDFETTAFMFPIDSLLLAESVLIPGAGIVGEHDAATDNQAAGEAVSTT